MRMLLGGIKIPRVLPAATQPAAKLSLYFWARISGTATEEMVAAVAIAEPETAAKPAQEMIAAMDRPPRICPSQALNTRNRSRPNPPAPRNMPIKTNMGITLSV